MTFASGDAVFKSEEDMQKFADYASLYIMVNNMAMWANTLDWYSIANLQYVFAYLHKTIEFIHWANFDVIIRQ